MLHEIIDSFDKLYNRESKPIELEKLLNMTPSGHETRKKFNIDIRGVLWRNFMKLIYQPNGVDELSFNIALGKELMRMRRCSGMDDSELYVIGKYLTTLFMMNAKNWFEYKLTTEKNSKTSWIVPRAAALAWFNESLYIDIVDLPLLIPKKHMDEE
jgi:hypothetical protein